MSYHVIFIGFFAFGFFYSGLTLEAKRYPEKDCPFSFELPKEVETNITMQDRQGQLVTWSTKCRPLYKHEPDSKMSGCRISPLPPHHKICLKTSRWNDHDYIMMFTDLSDQSRTSIIYSALSADGDRLSITAHVKYAKTNAVIERTLSKILKISRSVRVRFGNQPSPVRKPIIINSAKKALSMRTVKTLDSCPFQFKLPKQYQAKIDRFPKGVAYSGKTDFGNWFAGCSSYAKAPEYLEYHRQNTNCYVEPVPPHTRICSTSKRWDGIDTLSLLNINGKTTINFQAYTKQNHSFLFTMSFNKQPDDTVIDKSLGIAQAIAASVRPLQK